MTTVGAWVQAFSAAGIIDASATRRLAMGRTRNWRSMMVKRGVFKGIVDLQAAINRYSAETNQDPKPFTWTANPDAIIEKVRRGKQALESIHQMMLNRSSGSMPVK
jgi:hypothetical protein